MSAQPRCHDCQHPCRRKPVGRKKPCDCSCHTAAPTVVELESDVAPRRYTRTRPSWWEDVDDITLDPAVTT